MPGDVFQALYFTLSADRFFLIPQHEELSGGDFTVVSLNGEERHVDIAAIAPFEVSEEQAQTYLHTQTEQAIAAFIDKLTTALRLGEADGETRPDIHKVAEQLGLKQTRGQADPEATEVALQHLVSDLRTVTASVTAADQHGLKAARKRLAARGLDIGEVLDEIPSYLHTIRQLDDASVTQAAIGGLKTLADAIENDQASLGQRIDELIMRLEQELEPLIAMNREREEQRQKEYRRSAASAISASLSAAGITPLTSPDGSYSNEHID